MLKYFIGLFLVLATVTGFASTAQRKFYSPFNQKMMDHMDLQRHEQVVRFQYNFARDGGTIGTIGLGEYLPAKAIITRSWLYVDTQLTDDGTGTVAIACEDANNIKTATDMTGSSAGALIEGESTGASSAFKASIAARCQISAVIAGANVTAGKLTGWVKYVIHD